MKPTQGNTAQGHVAHLQAALKRTESRIARNLDRVERTRRRVEESALMLRMWQQARDRVQVFRRRRLVVLAGGSDRLRDQEEFHG